MQAPQRTVHRLHNITPFVLTCCSDRYGHNKLKCEELLVREWQAGGVPCVVLRLPDVIGPRDGTGVCAQHVLRMLSLNTTADRFISYQLWMLCRHVVPRALQVPSAEWDKPLSFVFRSGV